MAIVHVSQEFSFSVKGAAGCWSGTLSPFEQALLRPLPSFPLEQLRRRFLYAATTNHDLVKSARATLQMAFDTEVGAALEKVISFPPDALTSNVCQRRRFLDVDADLRSFSFLLPPALDSAEKAGFLPQPYVNLLKLHLGSPYPRYRVAATAALLCFAAQYLVAG